jgi:hypothetical protein
MIGCLALMTACSGEDTRENTAGFVGGLVETLKGFVAGVEEGTAQGRESTEGASGARTLTRGEAIHEMVSFEVLEVTASAGETQVVVAAGIEADHAVHIADAFAEGNVLLLDADGFATPLRSGPDTIEIPAHARTRVTFIFAAEVANARSLRLWGQELLIPTP